MNEIEIFDGRRLCSDKLSSDLLPSRFICCTLLHFADHLVFCTCWNPPSPAAKVHTYSTTSSFLESSKQAHCSWAGDATVKVATYSSKNKAELIKIAVARWSLRQRALDTYILWYLRKSNIQQWKIKYECSWVPSYHFIYKHRSIAGTLRHQFLKPFFSRLRQMWLTDHNSWKHELLEFQTPYKHTIIWVQTWIKLMDITLTVTQVYSAAWKQTHFIYWMSSRSSLQSEVNTSQIKQIQTKEGTFPPP